MGLDFETSKRLNTLRMNWVCEISIFSFLPVPLVLTAHVSFYLPKVFSGESLVYGTDYHSS